MAQTSSQIRVAPRGEDVKTGGVEVVEAQTLRRENARLQALISELRTASPSVARLADLAVRREREAFDEKTRRALVLLRKKDAKIRELGEAVSRRRQKVDERSAMGGESDARGRSEAVRGGGSEGGEGRMDKENLVVRRLEGCVEEQAEQIEALLEEVVRLRSKSRLRPSHAEDESRGLAHASLQGLTSNQSARRENTSTARAESPQRSVAEASKTEAWREQGMGREGTEAPARTDELRAQLARLESALAVQAASLAQKDAALERASECHRREVEELREREVRLVERVETLERLQTSARRTVLDREERIRQMEADRGTPIGRTSGDASENELVGDALGASARGGGAEKSGGIKATGTEGQLAESGRTTEKDLEDFFGAQEWWLHLAMAEKRREGGQKLSEGVDVASRKGDVGGVSGSGEVDKEVRRLRKLVEQQGLQVVILRQSVLKAEIASRNRGREEEKVATENKARLAKAECSLKTQKLTESTRVAELEQQVAALRTQGDVREALVAAREEVSAAKLALIRAQGDAELHSQLLEDEKQRSVAALSRAEDLQGEMDRLAVERTLRGVSGGVSASVLIDHFSGTLFRQARRVEHLKREVRDMRTRCSRLARLARGDPADVSPASATCGVNAAGAEDKKCKERNDDWVEASVQEAAAAMEAGRRRALEEEVESLRNEVLDERRRADAAQRDAGDECRHRSLAATASGSQDDDAAALRRKLAISSSEIEALRVYTKDLRNQIQSGYWSCQIHDAGADGRGSGEGEGAIGEDVDFSDGVLGARTAGMALKEVGVTSSGGGDDANASAEVSRLSSLLAERDVQVSVLTSTVEVLQSPSAFVPSPSKAGGASHAGGSGGRGDGTADNASSHHGATWHNLAGKEGLSGSWAEAAADVDGGVGVLNHIGAQGLARHCVALAVRLTSTTARAGAAERRADRLASEVERQERKVRLSGMAEADVSRRNRVLEKKLRKSAAALSGLRVESTTRLQEAEKEASQLRSALRDAELGADDVQRRLQAIGAEAQALVVELQTCRERHRDEILRLSDNHDTKLKEYADRLSVDAQLPLPRGRLLAEGGGGTGLTSTTVISPVASAIAELVGQWRTLFAQEKSKRRQRRASTATTVQGRRLEDKSGGRREDEGISEQQLHAAAFLQQTATRLDAECFRAVRYSRVLELELRGARQGALDAKMAFEELRVEAARLSARAAAAEAAVAAGSFMTTPLAGNSSFSCANPTATSVLGGDGHDRFGLSASGADVGKVRTGSYTVAAVSLLEKRFAAAVEDLVASETAKAVAEAGEAAATARAEEAEAEAMGAQATADVLGAELERHKASALDGVAAEAAEWRREIRSELGRWWQGELMPLHSGVALDWGSSGAADETTAAWAARKRTATATVPPSRSGCVSDNRYLDGDAVNVGVSGEEAMAQALIAGRVEQAVLEERVRATERHLARVRGEALHLRAVLERWHGEFVEPAMQLRRRRPEEAEPRKGVADRNGALDRKLLAATADLLGARDEATGLRREITALKSLVARLREDENEVRETARHRIESAREAVRRRAEGDLRDAAERLAEERERFKSQLGAAHADILRLGAEVAELERRNHEFTLARTNEDLIDWRGSTSKEGIHGDGRNDNPKLDRRVVDNGEASGAALDRLGDGAASAQGGDKERAQRHEIEEERDALRQMCNGLAIDLKTAVEGRAEAEDNRDALVQEAVKAQAEAQMAGLARENQEAALKELGRLLEIAREAATEDRGGTGGDQERSLNTAALATGDRSKEEAQQFARIMVAAKVAEADLLRRLQGAAAAEAELRHMLRRRDIRIEELKRDQATANRLAGSNNGTTWSVLVNDRGLARSANAANDGYGFGASTNKELSAAERAAKEVAMAAHVKRLELELAEATARGDVGDASTRAAERLANRLLSDPMGGRGGECRLCGRPLQRENRAMGLEASLGRGASFLMPSADIERKAAARVAAASGAIANGEVQTAHADANAAIRPRLSPTSGGDRLTDDKPSASVADGSGGTPGRGPAMEDHSDHNLERSNTFTPTGRREDPSAGPQGLSKGVRSLEAHLARLEAVTDCGFAASADASGSHFRAGSPRDGSGTVAMAWAEAVRELREEVVELRHRAEITEELLDDERAVKGDLEEEVLRLRGELLRQQRSYWQATATLKDRYERSLQGGGADNQPPPGPEPFRRTAGVGDDPKGEGLRASAGLRVVDVGVRDESASRGRQQPADTQISHDEVGEMRDIRAQERLLRDSLRDVEERLRRREQELQDLRDLHAKEAQDAKTELARAVEAHRERVGTLEERLKRNSRRLKAVARPKPTRAQGRSKEKVAGAGGGGGGGGGDPAVPSAPLTTDELLNMLAAADEDVFEAKRRTQRLEHELRAKTAEADALRKGTTTTPGAATIDVSEGADAGERGLVAGGGTVLGSTAACIGTSALAAVACAARLATAEAEVERLRDESLAASEAAIEAQREASALRLAARRKVADRSDEGRSREKELRRQVSAYKREADKLRSAAGGSRAFPGAGKDGNQNKSATVDENVGVLLSKTQAQLAAAREESERRGRTIVALRAAKTALSDDLCRRQQEAAELETKLTRALKDVGVKGSAVKTFREKISTLEAEVENVRKAARNSMASSARVGVSEGDAVPTSSGDAAGVDQPRPDTESATAVRDLKAERDRLRGSLRARQGSLAKQAAEIDVRVAEIERLEGEATTLRAAVARKDDAYRTTKKQLVSLREEYERFKDSSNRWRADAEVKWRNLKRASESAMKDAKTCRQSGDAAERELAALKSAFRSFLKTLWDDLRSRPPGTDAGNSSSVLPERNRGGADGTLRLGKAVPSEAGGAEAMAAAAQVEVGVPKGGEIVEADDGEVGLAGNGDGPSGRVPGGAFAELTEAEVSDIMQALSTDSSSPSSSSPYPDAAPAAPSQLQESSPRTQQLSGSSGIATTLPSLDREFEGEAAFSARVELALEGQNTSAALADMLRSLRADSFSKEASGVLNSGLLLPPPTPPRAETAPSEVWSGAGADVGWAVDAGGEAHTQGRWSHDQAADRVGDGSSGGGRGGGISSGGGRRLLSPLQEMPSSSRSDGGSSGFDGNFEKLVVEDLASS